MIKAELNIDLNQLKEEIVQEVVDALLPQLANHADNDTIFDVEGLAKYLKVGTQWVYENKNIPCFKIGKYKRFRKSKIDQWLCEYEQGSIKKQANSVRRKLESKQ
ncbi:MAG: helix-turn-helix domain-containing protein [Deltaproteobacteria bacterium]|nr:helix-turn-helix domain-containing protein [Deltaproteobacteria bacterium]